MAVGPQGQLALVGEFVGQLQIDGTDALDCEVPAGVACPFQDTNAFGAVFLP